jgi:hypothetical protein
MELDREHIALADPTDKGGRPLTAASAQIKPSTPLVPWGISVIDSGEFR